MLLSGANELLVGGVSHKQARVDRSPYDLVSTPNIPNPKCHSQACMPGFSWAHRWGSASQQLCNYLLSPDQNELGLLWVVHLRGAFKGALYCTDAVVKYWWKLNS